MPYQRPRHDWPGGSVRRIAHRARSLESNPWNDPAERELCVYLPAGYDEGAEPYIQLWDFAAFTNSGPGHLNWRNHGENLVQRLDRLIHERSLPPVVVAMPDCFTVLGGNQYVNSPSVGRYADYVIDELVPLLEGRYNVITSREGRGVFGKSSGGYGALFHAMHYPEVWGAAAAHAADCGFELVYRPEFPTACRVLTAHEGDVHAFLEHFWTSRRPDGDEFATLMIVAMAASYDGNTERPTDIRLPFDLQTCEIDPSRWKRWLEHDPLEMADAHRDALGSLHGLYLDAGCRDQYNIQFGARRLARKLESLGVRHHFEEFDGTHSHIDWRLDISLPLMAQALSAACNGRYHET